MAEIVRMPKMSDTMTEGVVAKWHKNVGDPVKSGELVAEIETDKATMEFESYQEGVLLYRGVENRIADQQPVLALHRVKQLLDRTDLQVIRREPLRVDGDFHAVSDEVLRQADAVVAHRITCMDVGSDDVKRAVHRGGRSQLIPSALRR